MQTRTITRFAVFLALASVSLIGPISTAQANSITYTLTSIPNATSVVYPDFLNSSLTDTLTGTITISSTQSILGTWNATTVSNITSPITLSYNISETNANVSNLNFLGSQDLATLINSNFIQGGGLTLTSSAMFVPNPNVSGGLVVLEADGGVISPYSVAVLEWNGNFFGWSTPNNLAGANIGILATYPSVNSIYGSGATWEVAKVVPEPGSLILLGSALLTLGSMRVLRRKRPSGL